MKVKSCPIPAESFLASDVATADFADAYEVENPQPERSALALCIDMGCFLFGFLELNHVKSI